jgi:hypothetical protein
LELGFDDVTPNNKKDISSWLYDYAADKVSIVDNRAKAVDARSAGIVDRRTQSSAPEAFAPGGLVGGSQ